MPRKIQSSFPRTVNAATSVGLRLLERRASLRTVLSTIKASWPCYRQSRRGAATLAFMLLSGAVLGSTDALADTIIFHDLTDTLSVEQIGSSDNLIISCTTTTIERCTVTVTRAGVTAQGAPGDSFIAEDASLQFASDRFVATPFSPNINSFSLLFDSLADESQMSCTAAFGSPCNTFETGRVQSLGQLTWAIGGADTIQFQSDVDATAVPEPSTALLLATVCPMLLGVAWRRRERAVLGAIGVQGAHT